MRRILPEYAMHKVENHLLWIGTAADGCDTKGILDRNIRAILQLAYEESPIHATRDLLLFRIPLVDGAGNDRAQLSLAVAILVRLIRLKIPTLVCCGGGMSRSPAITAAAIAVAEQKDLDDCLRRVAANYPADVSTTLWEQVRSVFQDVLDQSS